eukprot:9475264-Pyramimonas_sp.AAC.1
MGEGARGGYVVPIWEQSYSQHHDEEVQKLKAQSSEEETRKRLASMPPPPIPSKCLLPPLQSPPPLAPTSEPSQDCGSTMPASPHPPHP